MATEIFGVPYADVAAIVTPAHDFWMPAQVDAGSFGDDGTDDPKYYVFTFKGGNETHLRADQIVGVHLSASV